MADIYKKPQSPLYDKKEQAYFYPLTTSDQVILPNGERLPTALKSNIMQDFTNIIEGTPDGINADSLGGKTADNFIDKSTYDPNNQGIDVTVQTYIHSKSGTVHEFTGNGANGRALLTADVESGDTFTVNGEPVTAYMGATPAADAMAGQSFSGKWISFTQAGGIMSFAGGCANGLKMDLLWENQNPQIEFSNQEISLAESDLNKYKLFLSLFWVNTSYSTQDCYSTVVVPDIGTWTNGGYNYSSIRKVEINTSLKELLFSDSYKLSPDSLTFSTIDNTLMIPAKIYGIK